ncbi:unnamed protein product [Adineta ricciae]|uniref:Uncharacterized protein n=1 Tax=Adineta ricciae TaxID=249248 RepID=A0A814TJE2_ADIRI|nr:unnamed protein product [Adineta ricciae]CAF1160901.1 unnamed protein product [Adineta ricciae]
MTTVLRSKENECDLYLFKTPKRTSALSAATMNDRMFYSNTIKHIAFTSKTNTTDLSMHVTPMMTPIRSNRTTKFSTPASLQRRRALGQVNSNSKPICPILTSDDLSLSTDLKDLHLKHDELVILQAPSPAKSFSYVEDDLPHRSVHHNADTFNDLMPTNERIECMIRTKSTGINIFTFHGGIENTIRYQSPQCSRVDVFTLLDMLE